MNNTTNKITHSPSNVKPTAIYCRVSTEDQEREGTSLDTQRRACLKYCQEHGYQPVYQFSETASGLTLDRPELMKLRELVRTQQIQSIIIYCLDRFSRKAEHGVILTMELEKYGVTLEAVTEDIDTSELGKLISYIRGYAASLESEKLKERTTRGIRARVYDKGLPVTYRAPYGFQWDRENTRLVPDDNYENVKLILDLSVEGKTYDYIVNELKKRGISSPAGLSEWNKHTLSRIIHEPVYIGQYYAFRSQAVVPEKRNGTLYGKTSMKRLPESEWHLIPEIEVVDPPITPDQRALLLERLENRQKLSKRHATRDYLLRGMILCQTHKGKKGEPRRYHGQPHYDTWRYVCPVGDCDSPYLNGPVLEDWIKSWIKFLFELTDDALYSLISDKKGKQTTRESINTELTKLEKENERLIDNLVTVEDRFINNLITQEEHVRLRAKYEGKRTANQDRIEALLEQISILEREREAVNSFSKIRDSFLARLRKSVEPTVWDTAKSGSPEIENEIERTASLMAKNKYSTMTKEEWRKYLRDAKDYHDTIISEDESYKPLSVSEWREILTAFNFSLSIYPFKTKGKYKANFSINRKPVYFEMNLNLPLSESSKDSIGKIVSHSPGRG